MLLTLKEEYCLVLSLRKKLFGDYDRDDIQLEFMLVDVLDGPAEDLYGIFINRVRRERPPEVLDKVRG